MLFLDTTQREHCPDVLLMLFLDTIQREHCPPDVVPRHNPESTVLLMLFLDNHPLCLVSRYPHLQNVCTFVLPLPIL
jgi:hypothetical protein